MKRKKGFTIIELSLCIAFIAVLLIGIASLVMQMTSVYQKGLSIKAINATGQQIIEDMQRSINSSTYDVGGALGDDYIGVSLSKGNYEDAMHHYFYEKPDDDGKQLIGVFCLGRYAYLWNTAEALKEENNDKAITIEYGPPGDTTIVKPRLARFPDPTHASCDISNEYSITNTYDDGVRFVYVGTDAVDLIQQDEADIALYDFRISPAVQSKGTGQLFISASFILATIRGGVNINANGDYCRGSELPEGSEFSKYDFDYCAINKFNFSMRTGGRS